MAVVFAILSIAMLLGGCKKIDDTRLDEDLITLSELRGLMTKQAANPKEPQLIILDARRPTVIARGGIPGAQAIDLITIDSVQKRPDPKIARFDTKVVYGDNPADPIAKAVAKKMLEAGYEEVRWYRGGWEEWARSVGTGTRNDSAVVPVAPGTTGSR